MAQDFSPAGVLERFLRYVTYDTQSDETSDTYPSTGKQLLLRLFHSTDEAEAGTREAGRWPTGRHPYVTPPPSPTEGLTS